MIDHGHDPHVQDAIELLLSVDDRRVRLSGGDVNVAAEHGGVSPGLAGAIDDVRRARATAGAAHSPPEAPGTVAMDRAGRLLADSFVPAAVAGALAAQLARAESAAQPVWLGIVCEGDLSRLPWEALGDPRGGAALALHPLVNVYRRVRGPAVPTPVPAPLRILMAISAPDDGGGSLLDYERELRNVLEAARPARRGDARVRVVPFATTAQIRSALEAEQAHVLHLSCHGSPGSIVLEREDGTARRLDADTFLAEAIPPGTMPAVIALAACYTNVAEASDAASFASRLLERGVSVVIATETSITDVYATEVFARVYGHLATATIPDAVAALCDARRSVQCQMEAVRDSRKRVSATQERLVISDGLAEWAVLSVLATTGSVAVFDPEVTQSGPSPTPPFTIGEVAGRAVGEFVGRRRAQRHWPTELLADEHAGLVLHGIGGIGKTTLAAELVRRVQERDPDRVVAALRGELSIDTVLDAIVATLLDNGRLDGARATAVEEAGRSDLPWTERVALLSEHALTAIRMLVVLDNFEDNLDRDERGASVREPALAELVAELARDPGDLRLLITSRYQFDLPHAAEQRLAFRTVGSLSFAETRKLVWSLPVLDRELNDAQIAQVWRMVGGHPRALEYLDALLLSQGPGRYPAIAARLAQTLDERLPADEAAELRAAELRLDDAIAQVATRAADDVLLDELLGSLAGVAGAEMLLIGASVYREPIDVNALLYQIGEPGEREDSVFGSGDERIERVIEVLKTNGVPPDAPFASDLPGVLAGFVPHLKEQQRSPTPRRRRPEHFDELIGACVMSTLLSRGRDDEGIARMFVHRWTATELERHLTQKGRRQDIIEAHERAAEYWQWRVAVWPQGREADVHDLREARHHLLAADQPEQAEAATLAVCSHLHQWAAWDEEVALVRDTLSRLPETSGRTALWKAHLGRVANDRGHVREAQAWFGEAMGIFERTDNQAGMAISFHGLGVAAQKGGNLTEAENQYRKALSMFEQQGDLDGTATSYHQLGMLVHQRGHLRKAKTWHRRSLEIKERLEDQTGMAASYHELGIIAQERGRLREAEAHYRRSREISERLGNQHGMALAHQQLGLLAHERRHLQEAEAQYRKALEIFEKLKNNAGMAISHHELGIIAYEREDLHEAERQYRRSLEIKQRLGIKNGEALSLYQLGLVSQQRGDLQEAQTHYHSALDIFANLGDRAGVAASNRQLSNLAARGDESRRHRARWRR